MKKSNKANVAASVHQRLLDNSTENLAAIFREVASMDDDDGLIFFPDSVEAQKIKVDADYDVWRLSQQFEFDDAILGEAITQTFRNRGTDVIPFEELRAELLENETLEKQWNAFLAKSGVPGPKSFLEVVHQIDAFLDPLFKRIDHSG